MPTVTRPTGVSIELPEGSILREVGGGSVGAAMSTGPRPRVGERPLPTGPIPMPTATSPAADDPVVAALRDQAMSVLDTFEIAPDPAATAAGAARRVALDTAGTVDATTTSVDVGADEGAAVLLEQDGVYSWHLPEAERTVATPATRRGAIVIPARKRLVFDLPVAIGPGNAPVTRRRGPITDFVVGRVRAYVLRFVARVTVGPAMQLLERNARTGLVAIGSDDVAAWRPVEDLGALALPTDRPSRILLLVHGTFSSTAGSYGALGASEWGRTFLRAARAQYDVILGYDHRTLGLDPLENATDLLARLERGCPAHAPTIDAVAFSRGALVLRSLVEYLLPDSPLGARVRRAVFVGGTNGGTQFADPDNWDRLIDLYTNIAVGGCRALQLLAPSAVAATVLKESIQTLGALVKYMASVAVRDRVVPGLAAMAPQGDFVAQLNEVQPGQPGAVDTFYCVVTSAFDATLARDAEGAPELPRRLLTWILDSLADALQGEPNDLVVNTASMGAIDPHVGGFVKDRLDLGPNPHVYHTIYFTRPEVVRAIARWLELAPTADAVVAMRATRGGTADVPAAADPAIVVSSADTPFDAVLETVRVQLPSYVVVEREDPTFAAGHVRHYAYRAEDLLEIGSRMDAEAFDRKGHDPTFDRMDDDLIDQRNYDMVDGRRGGGGARHATPRPTLRDALQRDAVLGMHEWTESARAPIEAPLPPMAPVPPSAPSTARRTILFDGDTPRAVIESVDALPSSVSLGSLAMRITQAARGGLGGLESGALGGIIGGMSGSAPMGAAERIAQRRVMPAAGAPASAAPAGEAPRPAPARADHYFGAAMPEAVGVGRTASVTVTVAREAIPMAAGATSATSGPVGIATTRPLVVQVIPKKNLAVQGDDRVELDPLALHARTELIFDLTGTHAGDGELWVVVRQGGPMALATLVLRPRVDAPGATAGVTGLLRAAERAPAAEPEEDAALPVLQIFEQRNGASISYKFVLDMDDGSYLSRDSAPLQADRAAYVASVYKAIEDRWLGNQDDLDAFEQELRAYGGALLDELVPTDIQHALWTARDSLRAIQVVSEEPFIPWEIVHLKPPVAPGGVSPALPPETHFLAQKGLVRWLHNRGRAPREIHIRPDRAYYAIPDYPHSEWKLPAAQEEIPFLEGLGARPVTCEARAIRTLLAGPGTVDLFHFSGHGVAETGGAVNAQIMLVGRVEGARYVPLYLTAKLVQQHANLVSPDGSRPLVVFNACQIGRADWALTSIGGFAEAFVRTGAGAFVGTLWAVGDDPASRFTQGFDGQPGFYDALRAGRTLAEATAAGREAARASGEATWLAYVVYGHPNARVRFG